MKIRSIAIWVVILILIDQIVKIIIHKLFGHIHFEIIPSLLEFKPSFNTKHSWVNVLLNKYLGINLGLLLHLILYALIGCFIPILLSYYRRHINDNKKLIDLSMAFFVAAVICALIGNVIWTNGTLDYIYLKPLFIFDLKDLYVDLGAIMLFVYYIKNKEQFDKLSKGMRVRYMYVDVKDRLKALIIK